MTLSNLTTTIEQVAVGLSGESFAIPFPFAADSEIRLLEAGVLQTQGTIYTLTGAGTSSGGTLTYVGSPAASAAIEINRVVPNTQETNLQETGAFSAESVEDTLDKLTQQSQQSLQLDKTNGDTYDAGAGSSDTSRTRKIVSVKDPTAAQDAATKTYVDTAISSTGNVPAPIAADVDKHLEATAAGAFSWQTTEEVPTPVSDDVTGDKVLQATSAAVNGFGFQTVPAAGGRARNMIVNGQFSVAQHGTTFDSTTIPVNSNNTILLDRWRLLSNGDNIVDVSQSQVEVPNGALNSILLDVETGTTFKFGIIQVLEERDTVVAFDNQNGVVSISFEAFTPTGSSIGSLRVGPLSWVGTADAPTDPISTWGAAGVDPGLTTSWDYENTPETLSLVANSWTKFTVTNIPLDTSGIKNIALFIWTDDTAMTVGHFLYISNVQMVRGATIGEYGHRSHAEELALCQRYLQVYPAGAAEEPFGAGMNITTTTSSFIIPLTTTMRVKPTAVVVGSAATDFRVASLATVDACSAVTFAAATPKSVKLDTVHAAIGSLADPVMLEAVNANAKLTFDAEVQI